MSRIWMTKIGILESKIKAFQKQLGFRQEPMIVHRYDSLSLLNQVVFAKGPPEKPTGEGV